MNLPAERTQLFVGRQPILDRSLNTFGYELLFRDGGAEHADFGDPDIATARVLINAITEIGVDGLVGSGRAFFNITEAFITRPELLAGIPPEQVVLEILEDVSPTPAVVAGIAELARAGFRIALDDFVYRPDLEPLLEHAHMVKYDLAATPLGVLRDRIERDHAAGRTVVVERIETQTDQEVAAEAGADLFQGYFFARPETVDARGVPTNKLTLLHLLTQINDPEASLRDVVDALSHDVALSIKTLRFVNSSAAGLHARIDSIQHAAVMLGLDTLRSWATLTLLSAMDDQPAELVTLALTRARFCKLVAQDEAAPNVDTYYTVGMLSLLEAMTGSPMADIVAQMSLNDTIRGALLGEDHPTTDALRLAIDLEQHRVPVERIGDRYLQLHLDAMTWATRLLDTATPV